MTEFEKELIRAIQHGCPECGYEDLVAKAKEAMWYDVFIQDDQLEREWRDWIATWDEDGKLMPAKVEYLAITCDNPDCYTVLWTAEDGWIPELKEVVESD